MKKYIVCIREVWTQDVEVEAESEEEAIDLVRFESAGTMKALEFSFWMDTDTWGVEEVS